MFKRISVLAATLGAVALVGAGLAGSAFAQGPTQPVDPAQPQAGLGGRWGASQTAGSTLRGPAWGGQATLDAVSKLTGLSVTDIQAERQDGKSLSQIAQSAKVAKDKLVATILAAKKAVLDGLVKAGTLTQDQAGIMLDNMQDRVSTAVDRTETGPANGRGGGPCLEDGAAVPGAAVAGATGTAGAMRGRGGMGGFGGRFQSQTAQ